MKKHFLLIAAVYICLTGCYKKDIEEINARLDNIENSSIANIRQQISSMESSISLLKDVDKEVKTSIANLQSMDFELQKSINSNNEKIESLRTELLNTIDTKKAEVIAQLEALRSSMEGELLLVNNSIADLRKKDKQLEESISSIASRLTELKGYTDTEIANTKTWVNETFATLAQHSEVLEEIEGIKTSLGLINDSITELESRINNKITNDISVAVSGLDTKIQQTATQITETYGAAISNAKKEIEEAYSSAIKAAIEASEVALKNWVSEQLSGYYTISESDAKIAALKLEMQNSLAKEKVALEALIADLAESTSSEFDEKDKIIAGIQKDIDSINSKIEVINESIESLSVALEAAKKSITEAYTAAISSAISDLEGKLEGIAEAKVVAVNKEIVDTINGRLDALESDVAKLKSDVSDIFDKLSDISDAIEDIQKKLSSLLSRVQSMVVVPQYSDGSVKISQNPTVIDFEIKPLSVAKELVEIGSDIFSAKACAVETKSSSRFIDLPISAVSFNGEYVSVTISGENLPDSFFYINNPSFSANLSISNGNIEKDTPYFNLTPITSEEDLSLGGRANCYIVSKAGEYKFNVTTKGKSDQAVGEVASVEVLWESFGTSVIPSVGDIINNVSYKPEHICFTATGKDGNAVVAVKDKNGIILWSWHIWLCMGYHPEDTQQTYVKGAGIAMDRNLGAISAEPGSVGSLGLLYEWGRKDPFLGSSNINGAVTSKSTATWPASVTSTATTGTIEYSIQHPMTLLVGQNIKNADWEYDYYQTSGRVNSSRWHGDISLYDPCPAGWTIPDNNLWPNEGSSTTPSGSPDNINKGYMFNTTYSSAPSWYPAAGIILNGELSSVSTSCNYWSTTCNDLSKQLYVTISPFAFYPYNPIRADRGCSVRCCRK